MYNAADISQRRMSSRITQFLTPLTLLPMLLLIVAFRPEAAFAELIEWPLMNKSDQAVNDLTVKFDKPLQSVKADDINKAGWPRVGIQTADSLSADLTVAKFDPGHISLGKGKSLTLDFIAPSMTRVVKTDSRFTIDKREIGESVGFVGQAPNLFFAFQPSTQQFHGFAQFANPESFNVFYSNIQLFRNNQIANFNIDHFLVPTGALVTGVPASITLSPGQVSSPLSFGPIDPSQYELALADAAATSTPNDLFSFGSAAVVPEPSSSALFGLGGLSLLGYRWCRQRRRARTTRNPHLDAKLEAEPLEFVAGAEKVKSTGSGRFPI